MTSRPLLRIRDLAAQRDGLPVLEGLSLDVGQGEFVSIIGPSGSGKSTALAALTGDVRPSSGEILIEGRPLDRTDSPFAFMPQHDALLPWRRALGNATLGLEIQGLQAKQSEDRVKPLFGDFGLAGFERSWPFQLSGGMRQRVALLRTVVQERKILLLDEPFGALDALTRSDLQLWLEKMRSRFGWTVLLVTHDVREAVLLSDRVCVFSPRPARIIGTVDTDLPRPRSIETIASARFAALEGEVLRLLGATRSRAI